MSNPDPVHNILSCLRNVKKTASGWEACCPVHNDFHASLSIGTGEGGRVLLHCHAGCSAKAIMTAIGLKLQDLFPPHDGGVKPPTSVKDKEADMTTEERLATLEQEQAEMKAKLALLEKQLEAQPTEVRARRFVLVDENGTNRAELDLDFVGLRLSLHDEDGFSTRTSWALARMFGT